MARLSNRLWEYPPRPPNPPRDVRPKATNVRPLRVRTWMFGDAEQTEDVNTTPLQNTPIHALPPEILISIFSALVDIGHGPRLITGIILDKDILRLMLVCRLWHLLIVSTAPFWRHISASPKLSWVSLCLERSRDCLLDLHVSQPGCMDVDAISLVLPHARRVRSLTAYVNASWEHCELLRPLFSVGLPALERLEFVPRKHRWPPWIDKIDYNLSREAMPHLRSLVVERVVLPPPKGFWNSLRILKIYDYTAPENKPQRSLAELIRALAGNTALRELHLHFHRVFPTVDELADHGARVAGSRRQGDRPRVSLAHLERLSLQGPFTVVSALLHHLEFPTSIPNLDIRVCSRAIGEWPELVRSVLHQAHIRSVLERMTDLVVADRDFDQAAVYSPRTPWRLSEQPDKLSFVFDEHSHPSTDPLTRLQGLVRPLSWVPVRSLTLCASIVPALPDDGTGSSLWPILLGAFPSLECIHLFLRSSSGRRRATSLMEMFCALRPDGRTENGPGPGLVACPLLKRLSVHGPPRDAQLSMEALAECAGARRRVGVPFEEMDVHFWYEYSKPEDMNHWRALRPSADRARAEVGKFTLKFGISAGCRGCR